MKGEVADVVEWNHHNQDHGICPCFLSMEVKYMPDYPGNLPGLSLDFVTLVAVPPLQCGCTTTAMWLYHHCNVAVPPLQCGCTTTAMWLYHHCNVAGILWRDIVEALLSRSLLSPWLPACFSMKCGGGS